MPAKTSSAFARESLPTRSVSNDLSNAITCETFATESVGRPVRRDWRSTFPGASAHFRLLVSGTHRTVAILLRLKESPCTTITGRRNPGPEPVGSGRSAHQISPWEITIRPAPVLSLKPKRQTCLPFVRFAPRRGSAHPLRHRVNVALRIRVKPRSKSGFGICVPLALAVPPSQTHLLVVISLSSYRKYNRALARCQGRFFLFAQRRDKARGQLGWQNRRVYPRRLD